MTAVAGPFRRVPAAGSARQGPSVDRVRGALLEALPEGLARSSCRLADGLTLLATSVDAAEPVQVGDRIAVRLFWRLDRALPPGARLAVRLTDDEGRRLVDVTHDGDLRDGAPGAPALPPERWPTGGVVVDRLVFSVPPGAAGTSMSMEVRLEATTTPKAPGGGCPTGVGGWPRATTVNVAPLPGPRWPSTRVPTADVPRRSGAIALDGRLAEAAWRQAAFLGPFVDLDTGRPPVAGDLRASARLLADDDALYVGVQVGDPNVETSDGVRIILGSRVVTELTVGPAGPPRIGQVESTATTQGTLDAGTDQDEGYVVEARVPWSALAVDRGASETAVNGGWGSGAESPPRELGANLVVTSGDARIAWSAVFQQGSVRLTSRFGRLRFPD